MASRKVCFFHGFQEIKKAFLDFKVSSPFVRARALDHGEKVSQDHEIKKGFLDCQKERRVLLIWGFLDWFLNCSRKGSRNSRIGSLCMNLDLWSWFPWCSIRLRQENPRKKMKSRKGFLDSRFLILWFRIQEEIKKGSLCVLDLQELFLEMFLVGSWFKMSRKGFLIGSWFMKSRKGFLV